MYLTGSYSQNKLISMDKFQKLSLSKSNLSRMLKNIVYAGKILVPALNDEPSQIVEGLHKGIISMDTFNKVQYHLNLKSRYTHKPKKINNKLFLRGFEM